MNTVTDWRSYFGSTSDESSYAKDAKDPELGRFADLHINIGSGEPQSLEEVLKGRVVELWSDNAGRLCIVADEADAKRLMPDGVGRGEIYTAAEARRVVQIGDPSTVAEIHCWKRQFDGVIRERSSRGDSK